MPRLEIVPNSERVAQAIRGWTGTSKGVKSFMRGEVLVMDFTKLLRKLSRLPASMRTGKDWSSARDEYITHVHIQMRKQGFSADEYEVSAHD